LIAAGAGMSADSGLATFATASDKLGEVLEGLTYDQVASSNNMFQDPGLFFGFWAHSMQSYATAVPHDGYCVLREFADDLRSKTEQQQPGCSSSSPPRVFALTTNVDSLLLRSGVVMRQSLGEVHGSVARWQCGGVPSGKKFPLMCHPRCCDATFEPPPEFMPTQGSFRYQRPWPKCPHCDEGLARPHVFLFGDGNRFVDDRETLGISAFGRWREAMLSALRMDSSQRLVVLEVGCGLRVPNLRKRCEELFSEAPLGQCEFIRINPEFELNGIVATPTLPLRATARDALSRIHKVYSEMAIAVAKDLSRPQADLSITSAPSAACAQHNTTNLNVAPSSIAVHTISVKSIGDRPLRIVCLSDTHGMLHRRSACAVPHGDILVHCGDFTKRGKKEEVQTFNNFIATLPHKHKLAISGNHDVGPFTDFSAEHAMRMLPSMNYLSNTLMHVEGLRVYGSPWECRGQRRIPDGVDVLITHEPPAGMLDRGHGCEYLRKEVAERQPKLHIFGHIHEGHGIVVAGAGGEDVAATTFVNVAMANDGMVSKCLDKPITIIETEP